MRLRAKIGMLATVAVVAAGLVIGFMPRAVPVDVAEVRRAPLAVTVEEEGKTRVRERYLVSAPVAGYLRRIGFEAGDAVKAGQVLAVIEPTRAVALDPRTRAQAQSQVRAAEAAVAAAQESARAATAAAELATQERARTETLQRSDFVSAQALDNARASETRARASEEAARHRVRVARFDLESARAAVTSANRLAGGGAAEHVVVRAPVAAHVLKLVQESEGAVAAGQPLLEIGDPASLEVEVEVLSTHAVKIAPGSKVILDRWGGERAVEGRVRVVEPSGYTKISALGVEEQRVRVIVDFAAPREAWARLGDGYRVEARFVLWEGQNILQVPTSALFREGEGWAVFVIDGQRAQRTPVEIGQRAGLATQVVSGIEPGQKIVSHPDETIGDGVKVKPRR
jgi:HlyD family secretion protein